jgi:hypothetical protein
MIAQRTATGRARQRGSSALETAICLPPLMLLLTMAADHAWLALVQHQLAHAARAASRFGITGQADAPANSAALVPLCPGSGLAAGAPRVDRIRAIVAAESGVVLRVADLCLGVGSYVGYQGVGRPEPLVDVNGNGRRDTGEAFTDVNGNGQWDADQAQATPGGGDQVAVYTLRYVSHPLTGVVPGLARDIPLQTRVVVRNEPF